MNIAIIPARSGSKRIPRKNIKDFCGKPILAYAISVAKSARIFDEIIVSTDCAEIQAVARDFGAESPHLREKYSDDFATTIDVLAYEAEHLRLQKKDCVCCIYPCTPLLNAYFLKSGFEKFLQNPARYVFSACEYSANPLRSFFVRGDKIQMLSEYFVNSPLTQDSQNLAIARSQDLEKLYFDAGQFYFGSAENFLAKKPIFSADSAIIKIPQIFASDINTPEDWEIAEIKYRILSQNLAQNPRKKAQNPTK